MPEFSKECDKDQGFDFKQEEHKTFGYINTLVIGEVEIAPDIKVPEPSADSGVKIKSSGAGGAAGDDAGTTGIFKKPVVGVLKKAEWSTKPTDTIKFEGLLSTSNMQVISMLTMMSLSKITVRFSFVIYEYDPVANVYYPSFCSKAGSAPTNVAPAESKGLDGFGTDPNAKPIYGVLGKDGPDGAFQLSVTTAISGDAPLGMKVHDFILHVAPPTAKATQEIKIQTSNGNKIVKGWGLPQG